MPEEKTLAQATLCYLVTDSHVCLGIKKKKIGQGYRNGFGGGFDGNETTEACVIRECQEETGVKIREDSLEKVAIIDFHNTKSDGVGFVCRVYVYLAHRWEEEPQETQEIGDPQWFQKDQLPLADMMPADKYWLPLVLEGKKVLAKAWYGPFQKELLKPMEIEIVEEF